MKRDVILGITTAGVCVVLYRETLEVRNFAYAKVGAEFWPQIIIAAIFVLSLVQIGNGLRATVTHERGEGAPGFMERAIVPITVFAALGLFALIVPFVGFTVAGVVMVLALLTMLGPFSGRTLVIHAGVAFLSVVTMTLIFTQVMGILLPGWRL